MVDVVVPIGPFADQYCITGADSYNVGCGNITSPIISICCNGSILDSTQTLSWPKKSTLLLENLICCEGDAFVAWEATTCTSTFAPTPLASLAGTNTANALSWFDSITAIIQVPECAFLPMTGVTETLKGLATPVVTAGVSTGTGTGGGEVTGSRTAGTSVTTRTGSVVVSTKTGGAEGKEEVWIKAVVVAAGFAGFWISQA